MARKVIYKSVSYELGVFLSDLNKEGEDGWEYCFKGSKVHAFDSEEIIIYKKIVED